MADAAAKPLAEILKAVVGRLGYQQRLEQWRAVTVWSDAVGEMMARHVHALRVERGILWIRAASPAWGNEVILRKREVMLRLTQLGVRGLHDLRLDGRPPERSTSQAPSASPFAVPAWANTVERQPNMDQMGRSPAALAAIAAELPPALRQQFGSVRESITDDRLAESFQAVMIAHELRRRRIGENEESQP